MRYPEFINSSAGDYSCAACGMGMKEPCEHWKLMATPAPPVQVEGGEPRWKRQESCSECDGDGCAACEAIQPRCPKCGSNQIQLTFRLWPRPGCDPYCVSCRASFSADNLSDFAQFFRPSPSSTGEPTSECDCKWHECAGKVGGCGCKCHKDPAIRAAENIYKMYCHASYFKSISPEYNSAMLQGWAQIINTEFASGKLDQQKDLSGSSEGQGRVAGADAGNSQVRPDKPNQRPTPERPLVTPCIFWDCADCPGEGRDAETGTKMRRCACDCHTEPLKGGDSTASEPTGSSATPTSPEESVGLVGETCFHCAHTKALHAVSGCAWKGAEENTEMVCSCPGFETEKAKFRCPVQRNADPPQDCNWPFCGCDNEATKVISTLLECGWNSPEAAPKPAGEETLKPVTDNCTKCDGAGCYYLDGVPRCIECPRCKGSGKEAPQPRGIEERAPEPKDSAVSFMRDLRLREERASQFIEEHYDWDKSGRGYINKVTGKLALIHHVAAAFAQQETAQQRKLTLDWEARAKASDEAFAKTLAQYNSARDQNP